MTDSLTTIHADRFFGHPPEKVWRALTTPELMAEWFMPGDFRPEVGHAFTFQAAPVEQTGFSGTVACTVLEVTEGRRLRLSWDDAANPRVVPMEVTWTLEPEGHGTRLIIEHSGFDPDQPTQQIARRIMDGGWRSHIMNRFATVVEGMD